ncbi:hypothetical protein ACH5RR_001330 [Cinchona calisaya]|uniref:Uncharacterized protein n=1 Tax=Cinchona calisaya TaxID=153742 RepID=A0ABD3B4B3_9GENT
MKAKSEIWVPRQSYKCIGRLPFAHPNSSKHYYLCIKVHKVSGAKSFQDLKTVSGVMHSIFKSGSMALGHLNDDNKWNEAFIKGSNFGISFNSSKYELYHANVLESNKSCEFVGTSSADSNR